MGAMTRMAPASVAVAHAATTDFRDIVGSGECGVRSRPRGWIHSPLLTPHSSLFSDRSYRVDPYLAQFQSVRREVGLSGGHPVGLKQVGECQGIVFVRQAPGVVLRHRGLHVNE